ncbi:MAG: phosphatase PAP2 family protein [Flavobacteriales bacterium]
MQLPFASALRNFTFIVLTGVVTGPCPAQALYTFTTGRELAITLPGLAFQGASYLVRPDVAGLWLKAQATDRSDIRAFDRPASFNWNTTAARTSDLLLVAGIGGALTMALIDRPTPGMGAPLAIIGETGMLTVGLTELVKNVAHRARPYAYNPEVPDNVRMAADAYTSFWSGHTATTAAMTFACAQLVQQSDASRTAKTITWSAAVAWPMAVGFYRVKAGKHFPTDVIAGYVIGAGIGLAVPYLHQTGRHDPAH